MESCLFSVIMPAYNTERFVRMALGSLVVQECQDFEVIFVDDGSTDETASVALEVLNKWGGRFTLIRQENRGQGGARNRGISHARGDYLFFLDSDDMALPDLFKRIRANVHDKIDLIVSGWDRIDEKGKIIESQKRCPGSFSPPNRSESIIQYLSGSGDFCAWMGGICVRRDFLAMNQIVFPEDLMVADDVLFISIVLLLSRSARTIPEPLVYSRKRSGSLTRQSDTLSRVSRDFFNINLRLLSCIEEKSLTLDALVEFLEGRVHAAFLDRLKMFIYARRYDLFWKMLRQPVARQNLFCVIKGKQQKFDDRLKAVMALWLPTLLLFRYNLKFRDRFE